MNYLIDVLRGKIDERITQLGHDKLSVFGVGHAHTIDIWRGVFRQLIAQGYLSVDTEGFGGLALCERCRPLLRSEEALWLRQITKPVKISRKTCDRPDFFSDEESELWEALRACRKQLATERGVPPYTIFHDTTLLQMLHERPTNLDEFTEISGVGAHKRDTYGAVFLSVIAPFARRTR